MKWSEGQDFVLINEIEGHEKYFCRCLCLCVLFDLKGKNVWDTTEVWESTQMWDFQFITILIAN
ncbi:MAG: hypothetical protein GY941_00085 [Planctomycetes bacterium]|nr:hypothetical protein [Planctomycetota bacterium]